MRVLEDYLEGPGRDASANTSAGTGPKDGNDPSLEFHIISLVSVANIWVDLKCLHKALFIGGFGSWVFFSFFNIIVDYISKNFFNNPNQTRATKKVTAIKTPNISTFKI